MKEVGDWLKKYGDSIYGTRAGPYANGLWGGSAYRDKTVYLHVLKWPGDMLRLRPLTAKIVMSRALTGGQLGLTQSEKGVDIALPENQRAPVDTVIELTLDQPVTDMQQDPALRPMFEDPKYGRIISARHPDSESRVHPRRIMPKITPCCLPATSSIMRFTRTTS